MITVNTKQLVSAIREADVYELPYMDAGTEYLYKNLYNRLAGGEVATLSSLDFDAFDSEDIDSLNNLHENIFERNGYAAGGIASVLRQIPPMYKAVGYV